MPIDEVEQGYNKDLEKKMIYIIKQVNKEKTDQNIHFLMDRHTVVEEYILEQHGIKPLKTLF